MRLSFESKDMREDGLSDIGRFSLPRITAEGSRPSQLRGQCEHEKFQRLKQIRLRNIIVLN
jgi:hypothetical protein